MIGEVRARSCIFARIVMLYSGSQGGNTETF
jgi:hypothetical protein